MRHVAPPKGTVRAEREAGDDSALLPAPHADENGKKLGRLVLVMEPVPPDVVADLAAVWRAAPMVTLLAGQALAVGMVGAAYADVFYNHGEPMEYHAVRRFLPWLEVWLVGREGGWRVVG